MRSSNESCDSRRTKSSGVLTTVVGQRGKKEEEVRAHLIPLCHSRILLCFKVSRCHPIWYFAGRELRNHICEGSQHVVALVLGFFAVFQLGLVVRDWKSQVVVQPIPAARITVNHCNTISKPTPALDELSVSLHVHLT